MASVFGQDALQKIRNNEGKSVVARMSIGSVRVFVHGTLYAVKRKTRGESVNTGDWKVMRWAHVEFNEGDVESVGRDPSGAVEIRLCPRQVPPATSA